MNSLFANIQGYFKESYSGRYLALLLGELFKTGPEKFFGSGGKWLNTTLAKFSIRSGEALCCLAVYVCVVCVIASAGDKAQVFDAQDGASDITVF